LTLPLVSTVNLPSPILRDPAVMYPRLALIADKLPTFKLLK